MATLNGGITSTSELIRVSGTPPAPGTYFTIDDEAFKANGATRGAQGRNFTRDYLAVDRGVAGTTKATHSNGATLTPYYPDAPGGGSGGVTVTDGTTTVNPATSIQVPAGTLTSPGGGVASVALIPTLLGPYRINFDDFQGTGGNFPIELTELPDGCLLLFSYVKTVTAWSGGGVSVATAEVGIAPTGDLTNGDDMFSTNLTNQRSNHGGKYYILNEGQVEAQAIEVITGTSLIVYLASINGTPSAGAADFYAIIAAPAS